MQTIWKFPLRYTDAPQSIRIPAGFNDLHFASQDGDPTLWAQVDPTASLVTRSFVMIGTGHAVPEGWKHVGSVQDGPWVWHFGEVS